MRSSFLEHVSIPMVTRYIIVTLGLTMMIINDNGTAMAARTANQFSFNLQLIGAIITCSIIVSIFSDDRRIRVLGSIPFVAFTVLLCATVFIQQIPLHVSLLYVGYAVQLVLSSLKGNAHD